MWVVTVRVDELARGEDSCCKKTSMLPLFVHEGLPRYEFGMRVDVRFEAAKIPPSFQPRLGLSVEQAGDERGGFLALLFSAPF
jgi:hypothetical protein